jgi:flagellar hook-length control protein FliK
VNRLASTLISDTRPEAIVRPIAEFALAAPSVTATSPLPAMVFPVHTTTLATPLAAPAAAAEVPAATVSQIVQAIRMQWSARGAGEAVIRLEPSQFGELTVALRVDQGAVTLRLQSDTPVVREWLQTNQPLLRQALAEHQLTLDRLEIAEPAAHDSSRDRDQRPADDRRARDQRRGRRPGPHATFEFEA